MFKRIFMAVVAAALTLGALDAHAQIVNVLPLTASDADGFSAMMEVGLEYRAGNINLLSDTGLVVQITKYASIVNSLGVHYDHRPPIGVEKVDTGIETSFAFEF